MEKFKNLKINKKNVLKLFAGIGIGGAILLSSKMASWTSTPVIPEDSPTIIESTYERETPTENIYETAENDLAKEYKTAFESSQDLMAELSEVYPKIVDFLNTWGPYLDQEKIMTIVNNLSVGQMDDKKYGDTLLAYYDPDDNTIYLKDKLKIKKDSQVKELKEHELFHSLFGKGFGGGKLNLSHTGLSIDEGFITLLTQESGDFDNAVYYKKNANYVRVLCELIGTDKFITAYSHNNLDELYEALSQYINKSDAKRLIKTIDKACLDYGILATEEDKEAWQIIEEIYLNKTGVSIKESTDYVMKIYSNKIYKTGYQIDGANSYADVNLRKNYFINVEPAKIVFEKDGKVYGEINCDDSEKESTDAVEKTH